jgi:hypothetical protein
MDIKSAVEIFREKTQFNKHCGLADKSREEVDLWLWAV